MLLLIRYFSVEIILTIKTKSLLTRGLSGQIANQTRNHNYMYAFNLN